tara:strand:+ start:197 stop:820 length:624 start_codon:yes stop_codon:yes gene_type:complete
MNASQILVDGFLKLTHDGKIRVCLEMDLVSDDDTVNVTSWFALWKKAFRVVAEKNLHSKLWNTLYNCGVVSGENPYEVAFLVAELEWNVSRGFMSRTEFESEQMRARGEQLRSFAAAGLDDRSKRQRLDEAAAVDGYRPEDLRRLARSEADRRRAELGAAKRVEAGCHPEGLAAEVLMNSMAAAPANQAVSGGCGFWLVAAGLAGPS